MDGNWSDINQAGAGRWDDSYGAGLVATLEGAVVLDEAMAAGTFASTASLRGAIVLDDATAAGELGAGEVDPPDPDPAVLAGAVVAAEAIAAGAFMATASLRGAVLATGAVAAGSFVDLIPELPTVFARIVVTKLQPERKVSSMATAEPVAPLDVRETGHTILCDFSAELAPFSATIVSVECEMDVRIGRDGNPASLLSGLPAILAGGQSVAQLVNPKAGPGRRSYALRFVATCSDGPKRTGVALFDVFRC